MNALLHLGLGNALMATVLAVLVAGIACVCRRPALIHCLWVLVLLKLITPSFVACRIPWLDEPKPFMQTQLESPKPTTECERTDAADGTITVADLAEFTLSHKSAISTRTTPLMPETGAVETTKIEPPTRIASSDFDRFDSVSRARFSILWPSLLGGIWITGSIACFILIACRISYFKRLLACARPPSPELREQVQRLADYLGLTACPAIWFVSGKVSPMVWALGGRPQLFVPSALWERLNEEQRTTLLVHELAHLRRRDQWVRALELIVTILYWWHPVVWWACREIREAEEQCCDAWVVWTLPKAARAYATALLATIDFLSETQSALPAVASGIGHVHDLRRRLTMIMQGTTPRALSGTGLALVLGLGALLLPLLPTWAQGPTTEPGEQRSAQEPPEHRSFQERFTRLLEQRREEAEQERFTAERQAAERQVEEMRRHLENMQREFQRAREQLEAAQHRLAELHAREDRGRRESEPGRAPTRVPPTPRREGSRDSERRLSDLEQKLEALIQEVQSLRREMRRSGPAMAPGMPGRPMSGPEGGMHGMPGPAARWPGAPSGPMAAPAPAPAPPGSPPATLPGAAPRPPAPAIVPADPDLPAAGQAPLVPSAGSPETPPVEAPQAETPR